MLNAPEKPNVSIVMPAFNRACFVAEAIGSLQGEPGIDESTCSAETTVRRSCEHSRWSPLPAGCRTQSA